ncbi:MAG TPA: FAD-binding oxidoreductase [Candidatus Polarisedimenticolia bacterium]|nr:FAD-binding oxidoreductase [Candidatus Polarisedimenticolia bacterium]
MISSASAVIIGGGVLGASAAFHLVAAGWKDLLLLDRYPAPGLGSTGRATGGFRAQFSTPVNIGLSLLSRQKLLRFQEETGVDPGYLPAGYLVLAESAAQADSLRGALETQHACGLLEARLVDAREALEIQPCLAPGEILGGAWCPTDGFIRPLKILEGYLAAASRHGLRIEWDVEVEDLEIGPGGRICRVRTSRGSVACEVVVNAAGAWAAPLAELAGIALPVKPVKRQVAATAVTRVLPEGMPMTIFAGNGFHVRVRDGRVLLLRPDPPATPDPYDTLVEPVWIDSLMKEARDRIPALRDVPVDVSASWAGLYEISPDRHALVGALPECDNFFCLTGASGHGVMHAPALGQILAEIVSTGRSLSIDATPLRPARFREGCLNEAGEIL